MSDDERKSVVSKSDDERKAIASMSDEKRRAIASMSATMKARRSLALSVYSCSITDRAKTDHVEEDGTAKWTCCLGAMAPLAVLAVCCSLLAAERGRRVDGTLHSSRELTARRQCASTFWIVAADEEGDGDLVLHGRCVEWH